MRALYIHQLTKTYSNGFTALRGVDLEVQEGDFFALLGANGAGKTTIIGIATGLVNKTKGNVQVLGHDIDSEPVAAKNQVGVVPQEFNFSIFEKCIDTVVWQAGYFGIPRAEAVTRAEEIFRKLGLYEKRNEPAKNLSGGMKRRLMIARALIHNPRLLILDEPTAGVDVELRLGMWEYLRELNKQGVTIILTTHYLEEAEELCNNMAIINHGVIVRTGKVKDLLRGLETETYEIDVQGKLPKTITIPHFQTSREDDNTLSVIIKKGQTVNEFISELTTKQIIVNGMRQKGNRMEELFLHTIKLDE